MKRLKTGYTLRESTFAENDLIKKLQNALRKYSKWPDPLTLILVKFLMFFAEKKIFKISNTEIFIVFYLKTT